MTLRIDSYRSRPVWPKKYNDALRKGVGFGTLTEQEAVRERGSMFRVLRRRRPMHKKSSSS